MSQVWERQIRGSPAMTLLVLADYAADDGSRCYPAVKTIAYKVGITPRQVKRILDKFRRSGVLVVVKQGRGRGITTRYRIDLSALPPKRPPPIEPDP
jgi:helix-turn-helix protein